MRIVENVLAVPWREIGECHASSFLVLEGGEVFLTYFYGSKEGRADVRIYGTRRNPVDGTWSTPVPLTEDDGMAHWNPVLHRRADGAVLLFYKVGASVPEWHTLCRISYDQCRTFGAPFPVVAGDVGGRGPVRTKIITLPDGSLLAPASTEIGEWKSFFDRSTDGGCTWVRGCDLAVPQGTLDGYDSRKNRGIIQPSAWVSREGVHALMRSSEGVLYRTDSTDGVTFCAPYPTEFPNNNSGIDLDVLPDGRLILCANPVAKNWGPRTPLSLFISEDNGRSFSLLRHLVGMPGEYSYPAVRYSGGLLHISFTHKRKSVQYLAIADL